MLRTQHAGEALNQQRIDQIELEKDPNGEGRK